MGIHDVGGTANEVARPSIKPHRVRRLLEEQLLSSLQPADVLPAERNLAERFGVSRMTIRGALKLLEDDGLVRTVPGVGTFVAAPHLSKAPILSSFSQDVRARGYLPGTRLIDTTARPADTDLALELAIEPGDEVYQLSRVRLADGVPICVERVRLPASVCAGLLDHDLEGSLYGLLAREFDVRIVRHDRRIRAVNVDPEHAELLHVHPRSAALFVEQTSYDQYDRRVESGRSVYRGDRYDFTTVTRSPTAPRPEGER
ncbi:GntR family transcriptional regulator [Allonocardiopsis opalescens]|uniref:GntR family transcriptional regulator n=1 Tax=Allonocardiopsis opalescens TaxID=1144618 RepID=A0A2T0QAV8_9ACTN|nr:GntR family transcriptional regulator [Allonocardiopsis opalescens]PRY00950.1 GntR family transcriptional regulator [Allonocardiopsis opalescens]